MCLLLRKIEKAKWMQNKILDGADASADAITSCLRTKDNELSAWEVPDESLVPDAVLAIVSTFDHLDTIDVVLLRQDAISEAGLEVKPTEGVTALKEFATNHRDIVHLTYRTLGEMARLIVDAIRGGRVRRYTGGQLRDLIRTAICGGRISINDLCESVKHKVC
jgi:hypothetical protein